MILSVDARLILFVAQLIAGVGKGVALVGFLRQLGIEETAFQLIRNGEYAMLPITFTGVGTHVRDFFIGYARARKRDFVIEIVRAADQARSYVGRANV